MAATAILDFKKSMPFLNPLSDLRKNWQECEDMHMEHDSNIEKRVFTKSKMAAATILKLNEPLPFHNHLTNPY